MSASASPLSQNIRDSPSISAPTTPGSPSRFPDLSGAASNEVPVPQRSSVLQGVEISSNDDDPTVQPSNLETLPRANFTLDSQGRPVGLTGPVAKMEQDPVIYLPKESESGGTQFVPFANNSWPAAKPSAAGEFNFETEVRFPLHLIKRDAEGKAILDAKGMQQWESKPYFLGQTTAFESINTAHALAEAWSQRKIRWGQDGQLHFEPQAFVDFNAFFDPVNRVLAFGIVPYKLPGQTDIKMFEMASSWEVGVHESGHAAHHELKPNRILTDVGFSQWGESMGDQLALWGSLTERDRVEAILAETHQDLSRSSAATRMGEVDGYLSGEGNRGMRDAFQAKKVSDTSTEPHERSEVLTGACYRIFLAIKTQFETSGATAVDATIEAANVMGMLLLRSCDFTPENAVTLEDVCKGMLKADRELLGGKHQKLITDEFVSRELFRPAASAGSQSASVTEWESHEKAVAALNLRLAPGARSADVDALLQNNLDKLGVSAPLGVTVQSDTTTDDGWRLIRIELTEGTGRVALANHGLLTFRPDGTLSDYHGVMPPGLQMGQALDLLKRAREQGLDRKGKLGFVQGENGVWTVQVVVPTLEPTTATKFQQHVQLFNLEQPHGALLDVPFLHHARKARYEHLKHLLPAGAELVLS